MRLKDTAKPAILMFEDADYLDEVKAWHRNGAKGYLHFSRNCWRSKDSWKTTRVSMTAREAVHKRVCPECFPRSFANSDVLDAALHLVRADEQIDVARKSLESRAMSSLSHAVDMLRFALNDIKPAGEFTELYTAQATRHALILDLQVKLKEALAANGEKARLEACADIIPVRKGQGILLPASANVPYANAQAVTRVGLTGSDPRSSQNALPLLYMVWSATRPVSREAALEAMNLYKVKTIRLRQFDQLIEVEAKSAKTQLVSGIVNDAWYTRVVLDIDALESRWEAEFQRNLFLSQPVTLGIDLRHPYGIPEKINGTVRSFSLRERTDVHVGNYPQVVAYWLMGSISERVSRSSDLLTFTEIETVSTLWDPGNASSVYSDFQVAANASRTL